MYQIEIANQQDLLDIDEDLIRGAAVKVLQAEETAGAEISIAIVDDPAIHTLNKQHLQHDYPTDVLSFLFSDEIDDVTGRLESEKHQAGPGADQSEAPLKAPLRGRNKQIDGEVIVSAETAIAAAADFEFPPHDELVLYVVHGLLHLVGYDDVDDDERALMRAREAAILESCELSPRVDR